MQKCDGLLKSQRRGMFVFVFVLGSWMIEVSNLDRSCCC